jgi:hypothetical protein
MSGFTIIPIEENKGEEKAREMLEDGDMWKEAVRGDNTTQSLSDWVENVLDNDGWENVLDTSLYPDSFDFDGQTFYFESGSCGQHQEKELKHYLIEKENFDWLMKIWDTYHLKDEIVILPEWIEKTEENEQEQLQKAFELLNEDGEL